MAKDVLEEFDSPIQGSGGGKTGGGHTAVEAEDTLRSKATASLVELIGEGENLGLLNGAKSIFLDGTPLQNADNSYNFTGITWEERTGTVDQTPFLGISDSEAEHSVNTEVKVSTGPVTQTITNANLTAVRIKIFIPALYQVKTSGRNAGDVIAHTVTYRIEWKSTGGSYTKVTGADITKDGKTTSGYEEAYRVNLTGTAPWTIKVTRVSADESLATKVSGTFFSSYTEIIDYKFSYPYCHILGIKVDTSLFGTSIPARAYHVGGRIIRVPNNYNTTTRTYTGLWDGSTFKLDWSDDPAWCYKDLINHPRYGLGRSIGNAFIDDATLYVISQRCNEIVGDGYGGTEHRFSCNLVLNTQAEAYQVINDMASIFHGLTYWASGMVTLTIDSPKDMTKIITNANVENGEFNWGTNSLRSRANAVIVAYNDPDDMYNQAFEIEQDNVSIAKYGYRPKSVSAFACSSRGQAKRLARWLLFTEQLEGTSCTYRAGEDHAYMLPGTIVGIVDSDQNGYRWGGRAVSYSGSTVTIDDSALDLSAMSGAKTFLYLDANGDAQSVGYVSKAGAVLTLASALPTNLDPNFIWAIEDSGTALPIPMRVLGSRRVEDGLYEVALVKYDENKFTQMDSGLDFDTVVPAALSSGPLPPPTSINVTTYLVGNSGTTSTIKATVSWLHPGDPRAVAFTVQQKTDGGQWFDIGEVQTSTIEVDNLREGKNYQFRVRSVSDKRNTVSTWLESTAADAPGRTDALPSITGLLATQIIKGISLSWVNPVDTGFKEVNIYRGTSNVFGSATLLAVSRSNKYVDHTGDTTLRYYWVQPIAHDPTATAAAVTGPVSDSGKYIVTGDIDPSYPLLGALVSGFYTKSGAYTVLPTDKGFSIDTTGTWTLSLPAVGVANAGFSLLVRNNGSGTITVDPNGSEQINGASTYALKAGWAVILVCSGSDWEAVGIPSPSTVDLSSVQTLQNKTLDNTNTVTLKDTLFTLQDDGDTTKQVRFQLSGLTTATLRTLTVPDATGTLVLDTATQTLTNKSIVATQLTGTIQAAQMPAHTGDVTNSAGSLALTIGAGAVTLAKQANLAANSIIGNNTGSAATPIALTVAQTKALLAISSSDLTDLSAAIVTIAGTQTVTGAKTFSAAATFTTTPVISNTSPRLDIDDTDGVVGGSNGGKINFLSSGTVTGLIGHKGTTVGHVYLESTRGSLILDADSANLGTNSTIAMNVDGVLSARVDAVGTSSPNATTLITREKGDFRYAQLSASNVFSADLTATNLFLTSTTTLTLASTAHAFQIGASAASNLSMDTTRIQSRLNGAIDTLNLNILGGSIVLGLNGSGTTNIRNTLALNGTSLTATAAEFNYVAGVTSAIQTQIDLKAPIASPTFTGTLTSPNSRLTSTTTLTLASTAHAFQIGASGASNLGADADQIQARNNGSAASLSLNPLGGSLVLGLNGSGTTNIRNTLALNGTSLTASAAEFNFVAGVTSAIQTQIDTKSPTASPTFTGVVTSPQLQLTSVTAVGLASTGHALQIGGTIANNLVMDREQLQARTNGVASVLSLNQQGGSLVLGLNGSGTTNIRNTLALNGTSLTATAAEFNYVAGVTSAIQTQLNSKAPLASPSFTGGALVTASAVTLTLDDTAGVVGGSQTAQLVLQANGTTNGIIGYNTTANGTMLIRVSQGNLLFDVDSNNLSASTTARFNLDGTLAVTIEPAGTSAGVATTAITREKGDTRYAQLGAANTFTVNSTLANTSPIFTINDTDGVVGGSNAGRVSFSSSGTVSGLLGHAGTSVGAMYLRATGGNVIIESDSNNTAASSLISFTVDGTGAARIEPAGTSSPNATTIITREKGDLRYAQLGATNTFTSAVTISAALTVNSVLTVSATGSGYGTGAGGAVTQGTSRATGVTLNKPCGQITMFSAAGVATWNTFVLTNSAIAATDVVVISQNGGTNQYVFSTKCAAGSVTIAFQTTGGTATDAPVLNFAVIKSVNS